jgi:undecaprenyl-diphosphatase
MRSTPTYTGPERRRAPRSPAAERWLRPVFALLRWIGAHVRGFHAAVGVFLLLGLALLVGAALSFAGLAELVEEGATQRADEAILLWMDSHAHPWLDAFALEVTALAGVAVVWLVLLLASLFLWQSRHRYSVLLLWVSYLGASLINFTVKAMYERPRPQLFEWRTPMAGHSSFPSGHSTTAVAVFAMLAYLIVRLEPTRSLRRLTLALAGVVIVLIGASRLYLGVHYPSDVVAGFALGLAWATFCALGIEAIRYFRSRSPGVERAERDLERGTAPIRDALGEPPPSRP